MLAGAEHKDQAVSKKIVSDGESSFFVFFFFFFGLEENVTETVTNIHALTPIHPTLW